MWSQLSVLNVPWSKVRRMPVSLFQAASGAMQLKPLPTQYQSFYEKIEQQLRFIANGMVTKTLTLSEAKSRLISLRAGLTMQWMDAQGRIINP